MVLKVQSHESLPGIPGIGPTALPKLLQIQDYPDGRVAVDQGDGSNVLPPSAAASAADWPAASRQCVLHNRNQLMAGAGRIELCRIGAQIGGLPAVSAVVATAAAAGVDRTACANDVKETADRRLAPVLAPVVPSEQSHIRNSKSLIHRGG
jgi:hypothetical protein